MTLIHHRLSGILFLMLLVWTVALVHPCRAEDGAFSQKRDQGLVPAALVSLASNYAVLVDKNEQKVYVFHSNDKGMELHFKAPCSTGMNDGSKEVSGDGRTPEGIYFATDRYSERELSPIYGSMAFNLNYPNFLDHRKGRTGYNIWIHGTDTDLNPFQSNGCVVLSDNDIQELSRFIELNKTPIIILDRLQWVSESTLLAVRREVSPLLDTWSDSFRKGNAAQLASVYEREELIDRVSLGQVADMVRSWESERLEASFDIERVSILHHDRHAVITFDHVVSFRERTWKLGHRVLFMGKKEDGWVITGDVIQEPVSPEFLGEQLTIIDTMVRIFSGVENMVERWRVSWQSGNMEQYALFYASDFRSGGMNRSRWLAHKRRVAAVNRNIAVTIGDLDVTPGSRLAKVTFLQEYRSSVHNDVGMKTLYLKKTGNTWKIYREEWRTLQAGEVDTQA